jgi:hypothetical protein
MSGRCRAIIDIAVTTTAPDHDPECPRQASVHRPALGTCSKVIGSIAFAPEPDPGVGGTWFGQQRRSSPGLMVMWGNPFL